jgi:hypothetical protein
MLITLSRGFSIPLADNSANNSLKELLKTAEVTRKRDRVVVTATIDRLFFSSLDASPKSPDDSFSGPGTSK